MWWRSDLSCCTSVKFFAVIWSPTFKSEVEKLKQLIVHCHVLLSIVIHLKQAAWYLEYAGGINIIDRRTFISCINLRIVKSIDNCYTVKMKH